MGHPVNRMVLDLSHHNTVNDFAEVKAAGIVGIIHKCTEGTSFVDDKYAGRRKGCAEHGIMWGAYHFATGSSAKSQADHFMRHADPDERTLMALDWEPYGDNTMHLDAAREFIEHIERLTGVPFSCVVYSGNLAKEELGSKADPFFGARRLWLAHYSSSPTVQASWDTFWLWQYSDGVNGPGPHGCPGCGGEVDTNSYDGTAKQLRAEWATGEPQPAPSPEPDEAVVRIHIEVPPGVRVEVIQENG